MRFSGLILVAAVLSMSAPTAAAQPAQTGGTAAAAAATANPELVGGLSKELGATPEQAAGAAGALFGVAKSRLSPQDFSKVSAAVPGMDALLKAAPASTGGGPGGALSQAIGTTGGVAGLSAAAGAFTKLGLKPDMVSRAVPILTNYVTKNGGDEVGKLLAGALR